jgi:iron complex transport system ATP-binding protein
MYAYLEKLARRRGAPQLILVTHHREDILPIFSQGLILKNGKVVSMGARDKVLAPPALARAFGVPVSTVKRYFL